MKILHFADLHLGVETYGSVDPVTGLSSRMLDILATLDSVVDYAIQNQVDLVLFCGDTYKSRDPSQTQQRELAKRLKQLSEAKIPVFLLVGNHDLPNAVNRATTVDIFGTLEVDNIYIGNQFDKYCISTKHGDLQIIALPWLKRSVLLSRNEEKNLSIDETNKRLEEIITTRISVLANEVNTNLPVLVAGHVSIASATHGSEKTMLVGRDPVLLISAIANPNFDYVALGHIHKKQVLNENPPVVYSGSLERLEFGDENEEKGFYIINIESENGNKKVDFQFHPVNARRFMTVQIDIDNNDNDPTSTIVTRLKLHDTEIRGAIVRIQLSLPRRLESTFRDNEIYKVLKEAYYVSVSRDITDDPHALDNMWVSESLTPLEALGKYLELKEMSEDHQKELLEYAENLVKETLSAEG